MGTRAKRAARCDGCRTHLTRCFCSEIPRLELSTKLVLIMHHHEVFKTTATGPLALRALPHSELHVHGQQGAPLDLSSLLMSDRRVMILFPQEGARPLTRELLNEDPRPVTLVVPDGTWRQATRAARRVPGLDRAEHVVLSAGPPSQYGLRREPKEHGLATFEAIARALGVLEGPEVQRRLEAVFARMVQTTLLTRGTLRDEDANTAGPASLGFTGSRDPIPKALGASGSTSTEPLEILYRDADLVAVNKPAGMLVHRGWARDGLPALQILRDQLGQYVYPVHRLDRATSGVLLFALSSEVARELQLAFNRHAVEKLYLTLCRGHSPTLVHVDHPLSKTSNAPARPAITDFRLLGHFERYGLYEARPKSGRLHQIRRHLKHMSHPIIGDVRYGKGEHNRIFRDRFGFHRLALHASELRLAHPRTHTELVVKAPLPPDFARLLEQLGLPQTPLFP